jgi:predicted metal-dependent hydrolase
MHYRQEIIDSVVVPELAHEVVYNHSDDFYRLVKQYYPQYDECHAKLKKGEFQ